MSWMLKIKLHNARYFKDRALLVAELEVRDIMGSHYEVWRGRPGEWETDIGPVTRPNRRRRHILNKEWKRQTREWWRQRHHDSIELVDQEKP